MIIFEYYIFDHFNWICIAILAIELYAMPLVQIERLKVSTIQSTDY